MKLTIEVSKQNKTRIIAEGKNWELKRSMPELMFLVTKTQSNIKTNLRMDNMFADWCKEHCDTPFH